MAKRRANGEGNIRKRKDGRWEGSTPQAMEDSQKTALSKNQDLTVGQWATLWFENYAKPAIQESTAKHYRNFIENHIIPRIGKIKLKKLTTLDIQKFYNKSRECGRVQRYKGQEDLSLSNKTIRGLHAVLRQCLEQAVTERLIPCNPTANCKLPPKEKKEMQIIPVEKLGAYL